MVLELVTLTRAVVGVQAQRDLEDMLEQIAKDNDLGDPTDSE